MEKVLVGAIAQETNAFNPVVSDRAYYSLLTPHGELFLSGETLMAQRDSADSIGGILQELEEAGAEIIPTVCLRAQSGGRMEHAVMEEFIDRIVQDIRAAGQIDGVFLMLHGATQITQVDDCCGYVLEKIRAEIGSDTVLAAALDLHANVTRRMFRAADVLCGYRKYPHTDKVEAGRRAARTGLAMIKRPMSKRGVSIPILLPASAYNTTCGPMSELMDRAAGLARQLGLVEYSVFQMQPWLDVAEGGSAVIAYGYDEAALERFVTEMVAQELTLMQTVSQQLTPLEEVIRAAAANETGRPYILCDAADSPNAGALGDDAGVLREVLRLAPQLRFAFAIVDDPAAQLAHRLGVGAEGEFTIGGAKGTGSTQVQVRARVALVSDGTIKCWSLGWNGMEKRLGKTAVLEIGNIRVLVCQRLSAVSDPQMYEAFGIRLNQMQLVDVKACTSFRAAYEPISARIFETNTFGVAALDLRTLPYRSLPHPFYPFDPVCREDIQTL